jgi:hypothetical protein
MKKQTWNENSQNDLSFKLERCSSKGYMYIILWKYNAEKNMWIFILSGLELYFYAISQICLEYNKLLKDMNVILYHLLYTGQIDDNCNLYILNFKQCKVLFK